MTENPTETKPDDTQMPLGPGGRSAVPCSPSFVFDVESIGLHGEGYAVGFVVIDKDGTELDSGVLACPPEKASGDDPDRKWVAENIPPIASNHLNPNNVRVYFWEKWMEWKAKGALMFAECAWPVEARFLIQCIEWDVNERRWHGPYPLHDVASVMLAAGMDPMANYDREPNELPKHDPLADARQSARLLREAFSRVGNIESMPTASNQG